MELDMSYLLGNSSKLMNIPVSSFKGRNLEHIFWSNPSKLRLTTLVEEEIFSSKEEFGYRYDSFSSYYVFIKNNGYMYVFGPSRSVPFSESQIREFAFAIGIKKDELEEFKKLITSITNLPLSTIILSCLSLYHTFTGKKLTIADFSPSIFSTSDEVIDKEEIKVTPHESSLEGENKLLSFVRNGDEKGLLEWVKQIPSIRPGETSFDSLRQTLNLYITTITLVSREAMKAGLDKDLSLSLSDSYLKLVEPLTKEDEIVLLQLNAIKDFTHRVSLLGDNKSILSKQIANYVASNLYRPIRLKEVASYLSMSIPSLCSKFKLETDQTVSSFINKIKIKQAKSLLEDKTKSIGEIAFYLGYSSTAHFSKSFKKETGSNPIEYRKIKVPILSNVF